MNGFLKNLAEKLQAAGGTAYLVGGCVRDYLLYGDNAGAKDFDVEVHGLEASELEKILSRFGKVDAVGKSFCVFKLRHGNIDYDFSLPRTEKKVGTGHKGFEVVGNPHLGTYEASRRRDFTINALMQNVLTGEIVDHFNGLHELQNGVIRVIDSETFKEDSLRVLRAAQFAARFGFRIESETVRLCKSINLSDLPAERLREEVYKLLLKSRKPSIGLFAMVDLGIAEKLFPMVLAMHGCMQREDYHMEKDTLIHTGMVMDVAAKEDLSKVDKLVLMLAALCHDFGKPLTTKVVDGIVRQHGHEEAGVKPTTDFLDILFVHTEEGRNVRKEVLDLVKHHLAPSSLYRNFVKGENQDSAIKRLAARGVNMKLLGLLSKADNLGRDPRSKEYGAEGARWFLETADRLSVLSAPEKPLVTGDDLLALGFTQGKALGDELKRLYDLQLSGVFSTKEEGLRNVLSFPMRQFL